MSLKKKKKGRRVNEQICQDRAAEEILDDGYNENCLLHYVTLTIFFHRPHSSHVSTKIKRPRVFYEYTGCHLSSGRRGLTFAARGRVQLLFVWKKNFDSKGDAPRRDELFRKCGCYGRTFKIDLVSFSFFFFFLQNINVEVSLFYLCYR